MSVVLSLASVLLAPALAPPQELLQIRPATPSVRRLATRLGVVVEGGRPGSLLLRSSRGAEGVRRAFAGEKGFVVVTRVPMATSASELARRAKALEREGADEADGGYLKAMEHYVRMRAYPYDTMDLDRFRKAGSTLQRLPAAALGSGGRTVDGRWSYLGPNRLDIPPQVIYNGAPSLAGRVNDLAYHPTLPNKYYAATVGGVWSTNDLGRTWFPLSDRWPNQWVSRIAVDPRNGGRVYAATGDYHGGERGSTGIYRTDDGGVSWTLTGASTFAGRQISSVVCDPDVPNLLHAATGRDGDGALWRSADGGATWVRSTSGGGSFDRFTFGPRDTAGLRNYYAVSGQVLLRSTDVGRTWRMMRSPIPTTPDLGNVDLAASPRVPGRIYLLVPSVGRVFRSDNFGSTWADVSAGLPPRSDQMWMQSDYYWHIGCSSAITGDVIYVGAMDLYQSTHNGGRFRSIGDVMAVFGARIHADQHCMAVNPRNANEMLFGNDGGAYRVAFNPADNSTRIDNLNATLGINQINKMVWHPTEPNSMIGGSYHNGVPSAVNGTASWFNVVAGDGYQGFYVGGDSVMATNQNGIFPGGRRSGLIHPLPLWFDPPAGEAWPFYRTMGQDPNNLTVLYHGTNYLRRIRPGVGAWLISGRIANQAFTTPTFAITAITVAKGNSNRIYVGTFDGNVWTTANGGTTWRQIDESFGGTDLPDQPITDIVPLASNDRDILVTMSGGLDSPKVWRCPDVNGSGPTWQAVNGSGPTALPNVGVNCVARDPDTPTTNWYLGTDAGVMMTTNGGRTWANAGSPLGLPDTQVNSIDANGTTRFLNVATWSRGVWRIGLPNRVPALASLTASPTTVPGGDQIVATVRLSMPVPPGGEARVLLFSSAPGVVPVPAAVDVPPLQTSVQVPLRTRSPLVTANVTLTAIYLGARRTQSVRVTGPGLGSLDIWPFDGIVGGLKGSARLRLSAPSPQGLTVFLTTGSPWIRNLPKQLDFDPGEEERTFTFDTAVPTKDVSGDITVSLGDARLVKSVLVRTPNIIGLSFSPSTTKGKIVTVGTITLDSVAPTGGTLVRLGASPAANLVVPTSVRVPAGKRTGTFSASAAPGARAVAVRVTGTTSRMTRQAVVTVNP